MVSIVLFMYSLLLILLIFWSLCVLCYNRLISMTVLTKDEYGYKKELTQLPTFAITVQTFFLYWGTLFVIIWCRYGNIFVFTDYLISRNSEPAIWEFCTAMKWLIKYNFGTIVFQSLAWLLQMLFSALLSIPKIVMQIISAVKFLAEQIYNCICCRKRINNRNNKAWWWKWRERRERRERNRKGLLEFFLKLSEYKHYRITYLCIWTWTHNERLKWQSNFIFAGCDNLPRNYTCIYD